MAAIWRDASPRIDGQTMEQLPLDLYIPADALAIWLAEFEGPLDLLLYLIRKNNIDILDIPIAEITAQYLSYIDVIKKSKQVELAAEYLVMAAWLAEIKSRMLLPAPPPQEVEEPVEDPRAQLIERLIEYERATRAADWLAQLPQQGRDWFTASIQPPPINKPPLAADLDALVKAARGLIRRGELTRAHKIRREPLSISAKMRQIRRQLDNGDVIALSSIIDAAEGEMGVAVSVVAITELAREGTLDWQQSQAFGPIWLWSREKAKGTK
ncbi:MAG TPA: segregation/condensation protein A [Halothiobacillaceae bacterium]|nr:segregation/condensation protein A [Halothiobacillaceae bacterium]